MGILIEYINNITSQILKSNTKVTWKYEASYAGALLEGLHRFYSNDDNDFWFDVFMQTPEYQRIDSINGGDWEDFYYYETPILDYQDYQ